MKYYNPKGGLLTQLSEFNLYESSVIIDSETGKLARTCVRLGVMTMAGIERNIHERLCEISLENIDTHIDSFTWEFIRYPDHSMSPVAFGYAIAHNEVPVEKIDKIVFDHGETFADYIRKADGLLDIVLREILTRKPVEKEPEVPTKWSSCGDGGPCTC